MNLTESKTGPSRAAGATWFLPILLFVAGGVYLWAGFDVLPAESHAIWIDMARPVSIEYPFELVEVGENGEKGFWIGAGAGRGWLGEAGGCASYGFYAPADGTYVVWAYSIWHDECTNAIYVEVDDGDKAVLGNDPVFDRWHWCRGFEIDIKRGFHVLRLSNHSDNIAVQKVFLADSTDCAPSQEELAAIELFNDNFNGCDHGNFPLWKPHGGNWSIENREQQDKADNLLVGKSTERALLALEDREWEECLLNVSVCSTGETSDGAWTGMCFGLENVRTYHEIRWSEQASGGSVKMEVVEVKGDLSEVLTAWDVPWEAGRWHELLADVQTDRVAITVDGGLRYEARLKSAPKGGIGLSLTGEAEAYFDNVRVWKPRIAGSR